MAAPDPPSSKSPEPTNSNGGSTPPETSSAIVVLGAGEAGTAVLHTLNDAGLAGDVTLIEPSSYHYEQPKWVKVGTAGMKKEDTRSSKHATIPTPVTWIRERVAEINPDVQTVTTDDDTTIGYDHLVVALGIETLWERIRDLRPNLGTHGICSVYGYSQAEKAWEMIRDFPGGRAIFTIPSTPHKGGSAPWLVLRRAASLWREHGVRDQTTLFLAVADPAHLKGDTFEELLRHRDDEDDLHVYTGYDLVNVRPEAHEAVFSVQKGASTSRNVLPYDLLHIVPPMRPPALLEQSGLAYRDGAMRGYLEVHPESLQHKRFSNVFGVGDALGIKGVKTGERAQEQACTVVQALEHRLSKHP